MVNLDKSSPHITASITPQPNGSGWNNTDVTVTFSCSDPLSGILTCPNPVTVASDGEGQMISGNAIDQAGNSATTSVTISLDKTPPMLSMPNLTSTYLYGYPLPFNFSTSDLLSGITNMAATLNGGPISNGNVVTLNKLGINTFTLSASDRAGNTSSQTTTFNVVYNFSGVLQPINPDGSSIFKLGSTVPVKFQLKDANGVYVSTAVAKIYLAKVTDGITGTELEVTSTSSADTGNTFRYDSSGNQYIFNLGTKSLSAGTWRIRIDLGDGTLNTALISLKK
ncbi:MAG: PxKF domain-containing protein [Nitrospirae bacterium]|nr:PxKF domain-containing protein [Nitrospirota bacterium]